MLRQLRFVALAVGLACRSSAPADRSTDASPAAAGKSAGDVPSAYPET